MREFTSLRLELASQVARLTLNRPETRNAFDEVMIAELQSAFDQLGKDESVRVVILTGEWKAFSAGANIDWMRRMGEADFEVNYRDALGLANMLHTIANCPKPTIARVNGPAMGGGIGLLAACDVTIGVVNSFFAFTEVKIGLAPAVISPYVISRIGASRARELFLTGRKIEASEALLYGLLDNVAPPNKLDAKVQEVVLQLLSGGPFASKAAKRLVRTVPNMLPDDYIDYTARMIAELRTSAEGREGNIAFLEKRPPAWLGKKN